MNAPATAKVNTSVSQSCTVGQLPELIEDAVTAGLVPFIKSSPGVGKSSVVHQFAKKHNLKVIDHRMSTSTPEDLTGLPEFYTNEQGERRSRFVPFGDLFPLENDPVPEGYDGWVIFLDEFNSAMRETIAASYKLILDRQVGQYNLHEKVAIILAGNLMDDKAIVNDIGTAAQSRVIHLNVETNWEDWVEWGWKNDIDSRVLSFISEYKNQVLIDFHPDHSDNTFCCPRTWEFMSHLIKDKDVKLEKMALYTGTITSSVARKFVAYTEVFNELVPIADILQDPEGCKLMTGSAAFAQMTVITENVTEQNFSNLLRYMRRLSAPLRVMFIRNCHHRAPNVMRNPDYTTELAAFAKMARGA